MDLFKTDIISNLKYNKFKKIRGVLFIILLIYGTPAFFMRGGNSSGRSELSEDLREYSELQIYYFGLIIIGLLFGLLHCYSWKINKLRILSIDENEIQIKKNEIENKIKLSEIIRIEIIRNSTYHKNDHIGKPYSGNNWVEIFLENNETMKYEFMIKSEEHNHEFENLIKNLYSKLRNRLNYKSI